MNYRLLPAVLIAVLPLAVMAPPAMPQQAFADVHVHFNWDQKEIISAEEIVARLKRANIAFSVVTATPSDLALELKRAGGDLVVQGELDLLYTDAPSGSQVQASISGEWRLAAIRPDPSTDSRYDTRGVPDSTSRPKSRFNRRRVTSR